MTGVNQVTKGQRVLQAERTSEQKHGEGRKPTASGESSARVAGISLYVCSHTRVFACTCMHTQASQMALVVKNPPGKAGRHRDVGSIPGLGRPPAGGLSNLLQHSCLENPMDGGAWRATVHSVAKSQTRLKQLSMPGHMHEHICSYGEA